MACIGSFIASERMELFAFKDYLRPDQFFHGKVNYQSAYFSHLKHIVKDPFHFYFYLLSFFIYLIPTISVISLRKSIFAQIIVIIEILFLFLYDIIEMNAGHIGVANGCKGCENHGFNHLYSVFGIIVSSTILYLILETFKTKKFKNHI